MRYEDFDVRFGELASDATEVRASCAEGEARGEFRAKALLAMASEDRTGVWRDLTVAHVLPVEKTLSSVGRNLFAKVFSGPIGDLFRTAVSSVKKDYSSGLRLKFHAADSSVVSNRVNALPWEVLCDPRSGSYFALSRLTPVVRFLATQQPWQPTSISREFRVLLVAPSIPTDLKLGEEVSSIKESFASLPSVQVKILSPCTLPRLREAMLDSEVHCLHFAGLAGWDSDSDSGALILEGVNPEGESVTSERLATLLLGMTSLRLVLLNACDTAKIVGNAPINPFRGLATTLVSAGVPAVIGMQFPISDNAAIAFSSAFYRRLALGEPIESALTEGRQNMYMLGRGSDFEWATPVLFTRLDGRSPLGDALRRRLRVFLCHASEDKPAVRDLYQQLLAADFDVWLDEVNLLPGQIWENEIERAMSESDAIVVCLSKVSVKKAGFVNKELRRALDLASRQPEGAMFLIPVCLEECPVPSSLTHIHHVDLSASDGRSRLLASLRRRAQALSLA